MGSAASTVREELQKPLDGSDLNTLSDARSEVARLRSEMHRSEAAVAASAGAGAPAVAPAEKTAPNHSSLIMRLYAERGARSGVEIDFETLRERWGFVEREPSTSEVMDTAFQEEGNLREVSSAPRARARASGVRPSA